MNYTNQTVNPDYLVLTDDDNNILSRWFIIDAEYTRKGQYIVSLHRDVIADNLDRVLNSTCFVEKGYVSNDSPFIYNKESMGFNQIKKGEYALKSNNGFPWLVAYLSRYHRNNQSGEYEYNEFEGELKDEVTTDPDYQVSSLGNYIYAKYADYSGHTASTYKAPRSVGFGVPYRTFATQQTSGTWTEIVNGVVTRPLSDNYSYLVTNIPLTKSGVPTKVFDLKGNVTDYSLNNTHDGTYWTIKYKSNGSAGGTPIQFLVGRNCVNYVHTLLNEDSYSNSDGMGTSSGDYPIWNRWAGNGTTPASNIDTATATNWYNQIYAVMQQGYEPEQGTNLPINTYLGGNNYGSSEGLATLMAENGKIIQVGTGTSAKYYRVSVDASTGEYVGFLYCQASSALALKMKEVLYSNFENHFKTDATYTAFRLKVGYMDVVKLSVTEISATVPSYHITYDQGVTRDAEFEIIAAPYTNETFQYTIGRNTYTISQNKDLALKWFEDIASRYHAADQLYDIQLLPYLPIQYDTHDFRNFQCFDLSYSSGTSHYALAFGVKVTNSSFSIESYTTSNLTPSLNTDLDFDETIKSDYKKATNLDLYRFVSPNGIGEYEFSPSKNNGISGFEIDCTLMPYNPYIKINPVYKNLYGADFDDYRGLICNGDFSLPILSDAWSTYQINNKYYQQIFDRNIASEEYNNGWQLAEDITGAATGAVSGAAAGALAGSVVPGIGTAIGAVVGGVAGAVGGAIDVVKGVNTRKDEIDRKKDQFQYELGTIKARPQSLTRTTSINKNNKYFPYIEYYTCTPEEEEAFENKIQYSGMTVGAIGTLRDFANAPTDYVYLQGSIVNINLEDDTHFATVINERLLGGIRLWVSNLV